MVSPFETYPSKTLFLSEYEFSEEFLLNLDKHLIHLRGDIYKTKSLPFGMKVDRLMIEYLGDETYAKKNFHMLDFSWFDNLKNMLKPGGKVYYEMRADEKTRQGKEKLPPLNKELRSVFDETKYFIDSFKSLGQEKRIRIVEDQIESKDINSEDTKLLMAHLFPNRFLLPVEDTIINFLSSEFKKHGFIAKGKFVKKGSLDHIPNRRYDVVVIEAFLPETKDMRKSLPEEKTSNSNN